MISQLCPLTSSKNYCRGWLRAKVRLKHHVFFAVEHTAETTHHVSAEPGLTSVCLRNIPLQDAGLQELAPYLEASILRLLILQKCGLTDESILTLQKLLKVYACATYLHSTYAYLHTSESDKWL